jgi:hypothetical protein
MSGMFEDFKQQKHTVQHQKKEDEEKISKNI